ncbi:MAG: hypothetical protein RMK97_02535 [Sutterellaceae bacterium]|nr:hypothetical protein [Burkholderiaceae bacterium]MDW8429373.1 hypothetical protein [Sutterellaceae bacterium]
MHNTRLVAEALADSPAAALVRRALDSQRIAKAINRSGTPLPPAFDPLAPGACELRGDTLWLVAPSPAAAAKMRQSLPQLLQALSRQGFDLTEIKVRLQPRRMSYPREDDPRSAIPCLCDHKREDLQQLLGALSLAEKLALTFPNSLLGLAASQLAARLRNKLAQTG